MPLLEDEASDPNDYRPCSRATGQLSITFSPDRNGKNAGQSESKNS